MSSSLTTLFAIPKPMTGDAERLQRNAFTSWKFLADRVHVILLGDDAGVAEAAREFGFDHCGDLQRSSQGTPLLDQAFSVARQSGTAPFLTYVNADILLGMDFLDALENLKRQPLGRFLGIGRRWESVLEESIESWSNDDVERWIARQRREVPTASVVCKDYFVFPRHLFNAIPSFCVGRGNWDNWMVRQAHRQGMPVIDLSESVTAVHQPHHHGHSGGRYRTYVSGEEAKRNQKLAGGRHLLLGAFANYTLRRGGPVEKLGWRAFSRHLDDVPRFLKLLSSFRNMTTETTHRDRP